MRKKRETTVDVESNGSSNTPIEAEVVFVDRPWTRRREAARAAVLSLILGETDEPEGTPDRVDVLASVGG
jgi:hypothetical protein